MASEFIGEVNWTVLTETPLALSRLLIVLRMSTVLTGEYYWWKTSSCQQMQDCAMTQLNVAIHIWLEFTEV